MFIYLFTETKPITRGQSFRKWAFRVLFSRNIVYAKMAISATYSIIQRLLDISGAASIHKRVREYTPPQYYKCLKNVSLSITSISTTSFSNLPSVKILNVGACCVFCHSFNQKTLRRTFAGHADRPVMSCHSNYRSTGPERDPEHHTGFNCLSSEGGLLSADWHSGRSAINILTEIEAWTPWTQTQYLC